MFVLFGFQMSFPNFFLSGNRLFPSFPFIINYIEIGQKTNATHSCRACDTVVAHLRFIVVLRWICPRVSFPGTCCILFFALACMTGREISYFILCILLFNSYCVLSPKSAEKEGSDPPFRVPEKMK